MVAKAPNERERDAERKRRDRQAGREVVIPKCANRRRRKRLEADDEAWLLYYFGEKSEANDPFWYKFTFQQSEMIAAIKRAIIYGGDQSIAASRGEGKTTIFERVMLKYHLTGVLTFSVLCAATGGMAENSLEAIKNALEENPLLLADYPEACVPVRALENTPNRAHYQIVSGNRFDNGKPFKCIPSKFTWCGQEIVFPAVPGSPSSGSIIATRGLDSAVRGLKRKGRRPQLVGIDDPDTEETARSEEQAKKLEDRIDRALGGLGGQRRSVARVMLTTLQSRTSVSYKFTDIEQKPGWKPRRFRFLITPPDRPDLWEEYVSLWVENLQSGDEFARGAHAFYLERRELMDAGAKVANEHRFDPSLLPDGSQLEVSALQHYHNAVARVGADAVATELDNDPPKISGPETAGITAALVESRISGLEKQAIPASTIAITVGIDIGKYACHWVVIAWLPGAVGLVIDHGVLEVYGTEDANERETIERAILSALLRWRDELLAEGRYVDSLGELRRIDRVLIDSGTYTQAAYEFVRLVGGTPFCAAKGISNWRPGTESEEHIVGHRWYINRQPKERLWLYGLDTDYWKHFVHDRFMTPTLDEEKAFRAGSLSLWAAPQPKAGQIRKRPHQSFAKHIVAEEWRELFVKGKGMKKGWHAVHSNNHWFDAAYMACAAGDMEGVKLLSAPIIAGPSYSPSPIETESRFTTPNGMPYLLTER